MVTERNISLTKSTPREIFLSDRKMTGPCHPRILRDWRRGPVVDPALVMSDEVADI